MSTDPRRPGPDPAPEGDPSAAAGPETPAGMGEGAVSPVPARPDGGGAAATPPAGGDAGADEGDATRIDHPSHAEAGETAQDAPHSVGIADASGDATRAGAAVGAGGQDATRLGHPSPGGAAVPEAPGAGADEAAATPPAGGGAGAEGGDATRIGPSGHGEVGGGAGDATRIAGTGGAAGGAGDATRVAPAAGDAAGAGAGHGETTRIGAAMVAQGVQRRAEIARTQFGTPAFQEQRQVQPVSPGVLINNNYRVQNLISAGGMGEVYRGENAFTGDPVAIKIVLPELARDPEIVSLFKREARILGQLTDDAIVRYHNFVLDTDLNRYCLVMEFIDGTHLWDYVDRHGPMVEAEALALMRRMATGLGKAHARGVTHRDLSPDNVILRGGRIEDAVLIDFGIARSDELGEGVLAGRFAGKLKYIAPEQLGHFGGRVGPHTDIYSMALMVAALLRGNPLEMGSSVVEAAQARRSIPDLGGLGPRAMPLLQYMLEPDPDHRPRDMAAVARMLDDPSHVPARYRLPLWREGAAGAGGGGGRRVPTLDQAMSGRPGSLPVDDDSDSPFGQAIPDRATLAEPVPRRHGGLVAVLLGTILAIGAGGWFWRDIWLPQAPVPLPQPVDPVAATAAADPWATALAALPPRDTATRAGWLAARDLPACTLARRVEAGPDAGQIALFAPDPAAAGGGALADAYAAAFGARPGVIERGVTPAQCAALQFAGALAGRAEAPPALAIDSDRLNSGGAVIGRVSGSAGRSLWLFLVSSGGGVHDLSSRLRAEADGSFTFEVGLELPPGEDGPLPQLLVAVASRSALVSAAAAADGVPAAEILPRALAEIAEAGGGAAADLAGFRLVRAVAPAAPPAPEDGDTPGPAPEAATDTEGGAAAGEGGGTDSEADALPGPVFNPGLPPLPRPDRATTAAPAGTAASEGATAASWRVRAGVSEGYVNVRAGAGTMHAVLFTLDAGTRGIAVAECRPPDPGGGAFDWCLIRHDGREGWVSSNGIERQ